MYVLSSLRSPRQRRQGHHDDRVRHRIGADNPLANGFGQPLSKKRSLDLWPRPSAPPSKGGAPSSEPTVAIHRECFPPVTYGKKDHQEKISRIISAIFQDNRFENHWPRLHMHGGILQYFVDLFPFDDENGIHQSRTFSLASLGTCCHCDFCARGYRCTV